MQKYVTIVIGVALVGTFIDSTAHGQRGRTRSVDAKLLEQFDADSNGWLDADERVEARKFHEANQEGGRRSIRRGGGNAEPPQPGPKVARTDVETFAGVPLYDQGTLRTIFIDFENDNWDDELSAFYHTDVELPATVYVDGKEYENVGIQYRGNSSFFAVSPGHKKSMSVTFDHVIEGQNLEGYRALTLLNAHADPSFLHSVLYLDLASDYIPAVKANYVHVVINGESFGTYVNQQRYNKDFLKEAYDTRQGIRFKSANRSRQGSFSYLGEDPAEYRKWYEIKSADKDESWQPLINVCRVLEETPPENLVDELGPIFNIDGALRYLALDIVMMSGDGYWLHGSDFNIYVDKEGVVHILHHDANEAFSAHGGRGGRGRGGQSDEDREPPTADVDPLGYMDDPNKALRHKMLAVPELQQKYLEYVRDIARDSLDWDNIGPKIEAYRSLIEPLVQQDTRKLYSTEQFSTSYDGGGEENPSASTLKGFIQHRREYLLNHPAIKALDDSDE